MRRAYDEYEFHTVFHAVHNFCAVDLSALYLDIIKDRLYTSLPDDPRRRAAQTVCFDVFSALAKGKGAFHVRYPQHGKHVEASLSEQVIALIQGSKVERIYPVSSGKPSTPTVQGTFRVYSKSPGFNAEGMYFSNYFIRGFAIHGYAEVPVFAASHGCLRVPIPDAIPIYSWVKIGDIVDVYP